MVWEKTRPVVDMVCRYMSAKWMVNVLKIKYQTKAKLYFKITNHFKYLWRWKAHKNPWNLLNEIKLGLWNFRMRLLILDHCVGSQMTSPVPQSYICCRRKNLIWIWKDFSGIHYATKICLRHKFLLYLRHFWL